MKALFVHDTYYSRAPDGTVYAHGAFPAQLWATRFLPYFKSVQVVGREKPYLPDVALTQTRSDHEHVQFKLLPNINTPLKRIFRAKSVINMIAEDVHVHDIVIIRGPVEFGMIAARIARKYNTPYVVEMSGCAYDHTRYHGGVIGRLYAPLKYVRARKMVRHAAAVTYVTQNFLQSRYPTNGFTATASNVEIDWPRPSVLAVRLAKIDHQPSVLRIGLIGNYGNDLKGLGVAIKALGAAKSHIPPFTLHILGNGDPARWQNQINAHGLQGRVVFDGTRAGGAAVLDWLENLDLYIQPSYHEGLSRALIEAMSRGLPCLSSDAGGSAELLDPENIHRRGDAKALSQRLIDICTDTPYLKTQADKNYITALRYTRQILEPIRAAFWQRVSEIPSHRDKDDSHHA